MKKKNLTLRYALTQMTYWGAYNGCFSFATAYMLKLGIPSGLVGTLVAASGLLSCFLQPILASVIDKSSKPLLTKFMAILGGFCVSLFAIQLIPGLPIYLAAVLYTMGLWFTNSMVPLMNSVYVEYTRSGYHINYGVSKGMGSASSAIGVLVSGFIMAQLGMSWTLVFYLSFYLLTLIFLLGFPKLKFKAQQGSVPDTGDTASADTASADAASAGTASAGAASADAASAGAAKPEGSPASESCSIPAFFKKYRWYCLSLTGFLLFAMFLSMTESYMIAIIERLGGDSSHVGVALFISTLVSTPVVFCFNLIRKKIPDLRLLRISAIMFLVRSILTFLAPTIFSIYMVQILHFCSYSFMSPTQVYYAGSKVNAADMVKGQAFITSAWSLGCSFGNFIGGQLLPFGVRIIMMSGILMAACGCVVLFLTIGKKDKSVTDEAEII